MQRGEDRPAWPEARVRVTAREGEILAWVAAGKSDWAIGQILNISGKTVNFHVENAKRKFGVGSRIQAVIVAMRSGIIEPLAELEAAMHTCVANPRPRSPDIEWARRRSGVGSNG